MEGLFSASELGDVGAIRAILTRGQATGLSVNDSDSEGYTALHYACSGGHAEAVQELLDFGADLSLKNVTKGQTPLHCACNGCHLAVVEALLAKPESIKSLNAVTKKFKYTALHCVSVSGKEDAAKIALLLLEAGAFVDKVDATGTTAFLYACRLGDARLAASLLQHGANPRVCDGLHKSAMHMTALSGNPKLIDLLHREGLACHIASKAKNTPLPPLHLAAKAGNAEACAKLLQLDARIDAAAPSGRRALHLAAHEGHISCVAALLKVKADVNAQDIDEYTPLAYAAYMGHTVVVELLLGAHADPNVCPHKTRVTPLHLAAREGHAQTVSAIALRIPRGVLDATDSAGRTALHLAAINGFPAVCTALLKAGADASIKDRKGATAAALAKKSGFLDIEALITRGVAIEHLRQQQQQQQQTSSRVGSRASEGVNTAKASNASQSQHLPRQSTNKKNLQVDTRASQQSQPRDAPPFVPTKAVARKGPPSPVRRAASGRRGGAHTSIAQRLRRFPDHIKCSPDYLQRQMLTMANREATLQKGQQFARAFALLRPDGQNPSANASRAPENARRNRYLDIVAYDHSRVVLDPQQSTSNTDYINANFIAGYRKGNEYIACQGPLANTVADFWQMMWENKAELIVMVASLVENGRPKCFKYWPSKKEMYAGGYKIELLEEKEIESAFISRKFRLSASNETTSRVVTQYQMHTWPDHGIPKYTKQFLSLLKQFNASKRKSAHPAVVHCSAGVGRSGTLICMDILYEQAMEGIVELDVEKTICGMRFFRNYLVQSLDQFVFVFKAAKDMLRQLVALAQIIKREKALAAAPATPVEGTNSNTSNRTQSESSSSSSNNRLDESTDSTGSPLASPKQHFVLPGESHRIDEPLDDDDELGFVDGEAQAPTVEGGDAYNSQSHYSAALELPVTFQLQYAGSQKVLVGKGAKVIIAALNTVGKRATSSRPLDYTITEEGIALKEAARAKGVTYNFSAVSSFMCGEIGRTRAAGFAESVKDFPAYHVFVSFVPAKQEFVAHVFFASSADVVDLLNMYLSHACDLFVLKSKKAQQTLPQAQIQTKVQQKPAEAANAAAIIRDDVVKSVNPAGVEEKGKTNKAADDGSSPRPPPRSHTQQRRQSPPKKLVRDNPFGSPTSPSRQTTADDPSPTTTTPATTTTTTTTNIKRRFSKTNPFANL